MSNTSKSSETNNDDSAQDDGLSQQEELKVEFEQLKAHVGEFIQLFKDYEKDRFKKTANRVQDELTGCRDSAAFGVQQMQQKGEQALDDAEAVIRKNPLTSLGVAFGVGYVLARLASGSR